MSKALVVLSGGQDSTTCLYYALREFNQVRALSFDYGQRHGPAELQAAVKVAQRADVALDTLKLDVLKQIGGNALTGVEAVSHAPVEKTGLPNTFVPGRNLLFLTAAAAFALKHDITDIVTGVCETDYSGYPDCRRNTVDALTLALRLGMDNQHITIHTPLMYMNKAQTVQLMESWGQLNALADTHTCYNGSVPPCGQCPACELRAKGFEEAGVNDPLLLKHAI